MGRGSIVFQGAQHALDPVIRVGDQIVEAIVTHGIADRKDAERRTAELLERVGLPSGRAEDFPHEFSGGQKQRVMIAMALACEPKLVIADEPTTALDVMVQAQVLQLLADLQRDMGLSILFITHDLSVLAQVSDRVAVMYAGRIVETGPAASVFADPRHPYSEALAGPSPRSVMSTTSSRRWGWTAIRRIRGSCPPGARSIRGAREPSRDAARIDPPPVLFGARSPRVVHPRRTGAGGLDRSEAVSDVAQTPTTSDPASKGTRCSRCRTST